MTNESLSELIERLRNVCEVSEKHPSIPISVTSGELRRVLIEAENAQRELEAHRLTAGYFVKSCATVTKLREKFNYCKTVLQKIATGRADGTTFEDTVYIMKTIASEAVAKCGDEE